MTLYCVKFIDVGPQKTPAVLEVRRFGSATEQALWQIEKPANVKVLYEWLEASVYGGLLQAGPVTKL